MKIVPLLVALIASSTCATRAQKPSTPVTPPSLASSYGGAWEWNLDGFSVDPTQWNARWTQKMTMIAAFAGYLVMLGYSMTVVVGAALFAVGLVKLTWPLIAALAAAAYGHKAKHKLFLAGGVIMSYCMAFGYSVV